MLNRLTNYATNGVCQFGTSVTYDSAGIGNITSKADVGAYSYPASGPESVRPHAVSAIAGTVDGLTNPQCSYDGNGNLTCISTGAACSGTIGKQIALTSFNMAASITQGTTTVSLSYDSEHKRLTQTATVSGTTTTTAYLNDPVSGAMSEKVQVSGGGVPVWTDYLTVDRNIVAQRQSAYAAATAWGFPKWGQFTWGAAPALNWAAFNWGAGYWSGSAPSLSYFVLDHLGSVAVVTDQNGNVINRLSYDPWGKRRNPNGSPAACGTLGSSTTRGFTNQEELDAVCFVNLNARIYDPSIGKFLSADPVVGNIYLPNAFNRYAYVLNNPLSFTDTTGLCFLGCFWNSPIFRDIAAIAVSAVAIEVLPGLLSGLSGVAEAAGVTATTLVAETASFDYGAAASLVASAGIAGGLAGAITTGTIKGTLLGIGEGLAFSEVGGLLASDTSPLLGSVTADTAVAHGFVGGIFSVAQGGNFGSGFLAGGVSGLADSPTFDTENFEANLVEHAVFGGAGSVLGGGKFANGAETGAFGYLFNFCLHNTSNCFPTTTLNGLTHYIAGSGTPLDLQFSEINTPNVNATYFPQVQDLLNSGQSGQYIIDTRMPYTTSNTFEILGNITLRLQGTLTIDESGSWSFNGTLKSFNDVYDFNWSTHRIWWAELLTRAGGLLPGKPYDIDINGAKPLAAGGTLP